MTKKNKLQPKESFDAFAKYEPFYTGGKIQFSKDGSFILSLCHDKLKKFNICSGESQDAIENVEGDELSCFLLADDDNTLITAAKNGIMRQWDLSTRSIKKSWKSLHIGPVSCMAFDSTITLLATGGSDSTLKVWDIIRKYYTHNLKGGKGIYSNVCFQKLGSELHIFGTTDDYSINIWNLHSSACIASLQGHYSTVTDLVFTKDSSLMLSSSRDKVVLAWDLSNFKLQKTIPIYECVEACFIAPENFSLPEANLNPEEIYFITAGDKGILKVWSLKSGNCVYVQANSPIVLPEDSSYEGSLITQGMHIPALNAIGVTTFEHNIVLFDLENFSVKKQFIGYNDDILSMKFIGKSENHLAVATNSSQIKIFDFPNFNCQLLKGHLDLVLALDVFQENRNILVSGSKDNNVKVWFLGKDSTLVNVYSGFGHSASVTAVACCRGKSLFFASGSEDTTLKLWEIPQKKPVIALKLLITPYNTIKAHDKHINYIDISQNDKLVATGSQDHTAKIWDVSDLSLVGTLRGHKKGVWCVTFSPVDLAVATSSGDETIRIWSLKDFTCLKVFQGHESTVLQISFLTRGTQLISSSSDGNIKLWDIKHNLCIKTLEGHEKKIWTMTSSSSEEFVASGGADSNIIVWKDTTSPEKEKIALETEQLIIQEQKLSNLVHEKNWCKALGLAITLEKPYLAYNIIEELLLQDDGQEVFKTVFLKLRQDQRETLLKFSVDWITNTKTYYPAILIITFCHHSYDFQDLSKITSMSSHVRDMLPYLERHYKRLLKRCEDMHILNFLVQSYKLTKNVELTKCQEQEVEEKANESVSNSTISNNCNKRVQESEDQNSKKLKTLHI